MDDYVKMALEIVKAQAGVRPMTAEEITAMAAELAKKIAGIDVGSVAESAADAAAPVLDPKKSIREKAVTCLECGKVMKLITAKHLASHGLTKAEYLAKYGLKKGASLIAKGIARARKEKMSEMKLWERRGAAKAAGAPNKEPKAPKKAAPADKK